MAILLNEARPELYNAHLLDFNTGSAGPNVNYFSSDVSLFFVKFATKASLRTITMKFEFVGDNEFDTVRSISDFTAMLMKSADFKLPDGFCYHCLLTKAGKTSRVTENIYTADFTFVGYRHLPEKTIYVSSNNRRIIVDGNYEASCVLKFRVSSSIAVVTVTNDSFNDVLRTSAPVNSILTIDGMNKRAFDSNGANVFSVCDFRNFPRLSYGENVINFSGVTNLTVSYLPIYV